MKIELMTSNCEFVTLEAKKQFHNIIESVKRVVNNLKQIEQDDFGREIISDQVKDSKTEIKKIIDRNLISVQKKSSQINQMSQKSSKDTLREMHILSLEIKELLEIIAEEYNLINELNSILSE